MMRLPAFESWRIGWLAVAAVILVGLFWPIGVDIVGTPARIVDIFFALLAAVSFAIAMTARIDGARIWIAGGLALICAVGLTVLIGRPALAGHAGMHVWLKAAALCLASWMLIEGLITTARRGGAPPWVAVGMPPLVLGAMVLLVWEWICVGAGVPSVILPSPLLVSATFAANAEILWTDFIHTFISEVLVGWVVGCLSGVAMAIVADGVPFLRRGLLPLGSFISALPLIGIAPIMVTWFGNGVAPMIAVIVLMTFFPMLVNTVAGLAAAGAMERDLMRSYGAGYGATLRLLCMPAAMPFIFNGLKINSTLAMIGAIVSEYFGRQTVGMGFRINTQAGLSNMDLVWSEIVVAALAGTLFYGVIALVERRITFWHPSHRRA